MSATTSIEWTDRTWNPVTGCRKVSPGCKHCYAEGVARRFWATQYPAVEIETGGPAGTMTRARAFTDVMTHEDRLLEPLSWKKPARVFVNSMSDLFHEDVDIEFIDRVFAVMARAESHTFQVLTKRPARMLEYLTHADTPWRIACEAERLNWADDVADDVDMSDVSLDAWPLPNVWLGVSVEDQPRADERIPLLLQTPAAVRFMSAEPLLGPVDLCRVQWPGKHRVDVLRAGTWELRSGFVAAGKPDFINHSDMERLEWVIVGGESGPGARPCDVAWARSIVRQCKSAGVPVFVKQLGTWVRDVNTAGFEGDKTGAWPMDTATSAVIEPVHQGDPVDVLLRNRKGGDPSEWPEDLRVREFPR